MWQAAHRVFFVQPWYVNDDVLEDPELYIYPEPPAASSQAQGLIQNTASAAGLQGPASKSPPPKLEHLTAGAPSVGLQPSRDAQPPQKRQRTGAQAAAASPAVPALGPQSGRSSPSPGELGRTKAASQDVGISLMPSDVTLQRREEQPLHAGMHKPGILPLLLAGNCKAKSRC